MISQLTPALFWDTDIKSLSEKEHAGFIIQRVSMLGTWQGWILLKTNYGIDKIKNRTPAGPLPGSQNIKLF